MRADLRGMCSGEHKASQSATKKRTNRASLCAGRSYSQMPVVAL